MLALFVPGDRPDRFEKAALSGADAVILDLEDAVAEQRKSLARDAVRSAFQSGIDAWVRINAPRSRHALEDLTMLSELPTAPTIVIPKVAAANDIGSVTARLPGSRIVALIESIEGLRHVDGIAAARGVWAIALGAYDLCAQLRARPTPEVLAPVRSQVVIAARRAALPALDTPFAGLDDEAGLAADARRAADFGFDGKLVIHPKHIPVIRAAFEPDASEVERARAIVDAAAAGGVVRAGDTMIDAPLLAAARQVLARAEKRNADA